MATLMDLIATKAEAKRVPLNVHLELTYRCNEQCVQCYCVVEHGRGRPGKEARAPHLQRFVRQPDRRGIFGSAGGE